MFALFNLGAREMVVLGGCFVLVVSTAVILAVVLPLLLRRKRPIEPDDAATPLERARDAAAVLTPEDRADLRRSLEERQPRPPASGEGIAP